MQPNEILCAFCLLNISIFQLQFFIWLVKMDYMNGKVLYNNYCQHETIFFKYWMIMRNGFCRRTQVTQRLISNILFIVVPSLCNRL